MENKINIAELLKDCPRGMELDSTLFEGLEFDAIVDNDYLPIRCRIKNPNGGYTVYNFTKYGCWLDTTFAKCVIFPKGKTTWEGFHRPFKDGDIVFYDDTVAIFKEWRDETLCRNYVIKYLDKDFSILMDMPLFGKSIRRKIRFATEEEKAKLFQAIQDNGYRWDDETKTLRIYPKFNVGDKVRHKAYPAFIYNITNITKDKYECGKSFIFKFTNQNDYELVPNKFDINTLVPFESKVLVRNDESQRWLPAFWGYKVVDGFITTFGWCKYCIPYKGNEILFRTNNDCDDFYKTWEK